MMPFALALLALAQPPPEPGARGISAAEMLRHIQVLASDTFEGRGPGTPGEELAVAYIVDQYRRLGLKPGNPDGTYIQEVPLVGFKTRATGEFHAGGRSIIPKPNGDWVAVSRRAADDVSVRNSEVVFVGYGVVAPEYQWDDYKGVDVKGKTIVMLVNDPAVVDPKDASKLDDNVFKGKAMTYYGRWSYKYEEAARQGAAAALIVHETGPAGYPFEVVVGSWSRENFDIPAADGNAGRPAVESWISLDLAKSLIAAGGQDFDALKKTAATRDFKPVALNSIADFTLKNTRRDVKSKNAVARLEGSDPRVKDETVIYTAHWDHLGKDEALKGDQIYNGAADNASGVAMMLEIAEGFASMPPPRRSILFLAVTAEEKGLLGAKYYAEHPLWPLETTLADINTDVINLWGRTTDVTSVGLGLSSLDESLGKLAAAKGRTVIGDPEPEKGSYYRSDHFEFAKKGVPALNAKGGVNYIGKPPGYGLQKRDEYTKNDYHKPSDEVKSGWDLAGAVDDARLLLEVGRVIAAGDTYPEWKLGSEFKAPREAMLKARAR